ncbi:MAG: hypothetical protein WD231_02650 [Candidatus Woykebacteria bacterium]
MPAQQSPAPVMANQNIQPPQNFPVNPIPNQTQPSLPDKQTPKSGSPAVSVFGILLVTLILFFGGYFYLQYQQNQNINQTKQTVVQRVEEQKKQATLAENSENDQTRKLDLATIKGGVSRYFEKNKKYPAKLEDLTEGSLQVIPLDPVTKKPYDYVPSETSTTYSLSAVLSDGSAYTVTQDHK